MGQDSLRHTPKMSQDSPKTDPSARRALHGVLQDANTVQKPRENQWFWHYRLFASDGLWMPQDGPKMAQKRPKRGPRRPKTAPRSPKRRPRALQEGPKMPFESLRGEMRIFIPSVFQPRCLRRPPGGFPDDCSCQVYVRIWFPERDH
eukprot:7814633-Pyramimonas_sp.AAC.1